MTQIIKSNYRFHDILVCLWSLVRQYRYLEFVNTMLIKMLTTLLLRWRNGLTLSCSAIMTTIEAWIYVNWAEWPSMPIAVQDPWDPWILWRVFSKNIKIICTALFLSSVGEFTQYFWNLIFKTPRGASLALAVKYITNGATYKLGTIWISSAWRSAFAFMST